MAFLDAALVIGAAGLSTLAGIAWIVVPMRSSGTAAAPKKPRQQDEISFLFENEHLHHASQGAMQLYKLMPGRDSWQAWREKMLNRFPALPERPTDTTEGQRIVQARHHEDTAVLDVTRNGEFTEVRMIDAETAEANPACNTAAMRRELADLWRASDTTPHPIWQISTEGRVTWYNAAYERLYKRLHGKPPQADKPVFAIDLGTIGTDPMRVSARIDDDAQPDWYDVSAIGAGDITILHAVDVNAVVKSEVAQRNFVQTLAKTFAQLSIGLAIFDRNGQLALFNPALIDLTDLPADFLSGRPTLLSFFDRMRENRRMPEPKNYHSWRQEIAEVIAAATDGRYQETWTLETGQTYRVKGRPHPDGAIAFLIEDISAEISLTRNFRAELELGQSLMDSFDEALAVFSPTGVLTFCNVAYRDLWGLDPDNSFADVTIADSVREWKRLCAPGARWAALSDFVLDYGESETWEMPVTLTSGAQLTCIVSRIALGATILRFVQREKPKRSQNKAKRPARLT